MRAIQSDHHATIQLLREEITSPTSSQTPAAAPASSPALLPTTHITSSTRLEYGLNSPPPLILSSQSEPLAAGESYQSYQSPVPGHNHPLGQGGPPLSTQGMLSPQSPPPPPPSSPPPPLSPLLAGQLWL